MKRNLKRALSLVLAVCLLLAVSPVTNTEAAGKKSEQWCGAWSTSPVKVDLKEILKLTKLKADLSLKKLTFRSVLQPTISGDKIRVTLSNEFGKGPLKIDAMTCAKIGNLGNRTLKKSTLKTVKFNGKSTVTIPAGKTVTSDPIDIKVYALESLAFSTYLKKTTYLSTYGLIGGDTYVSIGDDTKNTITAGIHMAYTGDFGEYSVIPMITELEVVHPNAKAAVVIGDSTLANDIPIILERKLQNAGIGNVAILQQAIKGNRLMEDGAGMIGSAYGESMLKRFERDALKQPGVSTIFLKVGCNDIIHPNCKSMMGIAKPSSVEEMIEGYKTLIDRAHAKGIKIYFFTRTAWKGYTRNLLGSGDDITWTEEIDGMRKDLNKWIRSEEFTGDGYIDLDFLCSDADFTEIKKEYTLDGVHFTDAGCKAVVNAMPLEWLK